MNGPIFKQELRMGVRVRAWALRDMLRSASCRRNHYVLAEYWDHSDGVNVTHPAKYNRATHKT